MIVEKGQNNKTPGIANPQQIRTMKVLRYALTLCPCWWQPSLLVFEVRHSNRD